MNLPSALAEIDELTVEERIALVQAIWDSVAAERGVPSLDDSLRAELDRRRAAHAADPDDVLTWEQIKLHARERR